MRTLASAGSAALTLALASFSSPPAAAGTFEILYSTSMSLGPIDETAVDGPLYESFSTGSSSVDNVLATIGIGNGGTPTGFFTINLYANSSNSPGALLGTFGTFNDNVIGIPTTTVLFGTGFFPLTLAANTRYWIGLLGTNSSMGWVHVTDASGTGVAGEFWANSPGGVLTVNANSNAAPPYEMTVSGTTVPEPSTWVMLTLGFAGLGFAAYRASRATVAFSI